MSALLHIHGKDFDLDLPLGSAPAAPTAGAATWEEIARPGRTSLSHFLGNELVKLDVPVFFDGWPDRSVETEVRQVLALCRSGEIGRLPPTFYATGPIPYSGTRFYMELPEWGDGLRGDRGGPVEGQLVRQALTLKLVQFVDPDTVRVTRRQRASIGRAKALSRTITLQARMNLIEIAAHFLHDASRAREIAKLNHIRDTRKKLAAGTKIRLPVT